MRCDSGMTCKQIDLVGGSAQKRLEKLAISYNSATGAEHRDGNQLLIICKAFFGGDQNMMHGRGSQSEDPSMF